MHVFKTVKSVTKTDISYAINEHNVYVVFLRNEYARKNPRNNKHITYLAFTALKMSVEKHKTKCSLLLSFLYTIQQ